MTTPLSPRLSTAAMLDFSAPELAKAVDMVRSDSSPENFCVFGYQGASKIVFKSSGTTAFRGLVDCLSDFEISFALVRVDKKRDDFTSAVTFVYVTWVGPRVDAWARGRVAPHHIELKKLMGYTVLDIQTDDKTTLAEDVVRDKLKKASWKVLKVVTDVVMQQVPKPEPPMGEYVIRVDSHL